MENNKGHSIPFVVRVSSKRFSSSQESKLNWKKEVLMTLWPMLFHKSFAIAQSCKIWSVVSGQHHTLDKYLDLWFLSETRHNLSVMYCLPLSTKTLSIFRGIDFPNLFADSVLPCNISLYDAIVGWLLSKFTWNIWKPSNPVQTCRDIGGFYRKEQLK